MGFRNRDSPQSFNESYIIKTPELDYEPNPRGMGHEFFRSMLKHHDKIAQIDAETGEIDKHGSLLKRCVRTALNMQTLGITSEDITCICSNNHLNSCVPFIASLFLNVKVCSLDPSLSLNDTSYLLKLVSPKIVFVISEAETLIKDALLEADIDAKIVVFGETESSLKFEEFLKSHEDEKSFLPLGVENDKDTAVILFSSGTTGFPKGICLNHRALLCQGANMIKMGQIISVTMAYSSLYWISAVCLLAGTILSGTTRLISTHFNPSKTWHYIEKYKVTFLFLAPNQAINIRKAGRPDNIDTTSLLEMVIGGASISRDQLIELRDVFPGTNISQGYGQTEVSGVICVFRPNNRKDNIFLLSKPDSCGTPINGIWCKVVDVESEKLLGPHEEGELRIKSDYVMNGYYKQDSSDSWDSEGWLRTGDVVYYDEDTFFYVVDRIKEMLKFRSWHVAPAVLENVINSHPAVRACVVIGIPHPEDGDHPMACVILNEDYENVTSEDIEKFVEDKVQDRQRLRGGVQFINTFPTTPTGKIRRRELRAMILNRDI